MRILSIFLTLTILIAGVPSCAEPIADEPVQRNLTVSSSDGGSVTTPGEDTFAYDEGTVVDLVATADSGYYFVEWTGDVDTAASITVATTTITMSGDYSIAASFLEIPSTQYNLSISSTTGGSVIAPGEGTFTYDAGTVVSLVTAADANCRFVKWTGDVSTVADVNAASTTVAMYGDYLITADFVARYALTIESTDGGQVTTPGEGTFTYDAGTVVDLIAKAEDGYGFATWKGDVTGITDANGASTTITMKGDYSIAASFGVAVYDWYDLDAIRQDLQGSHVLMNDLDSASAGYASLASPAAHGGKGWDPIGKRGQGEEHFWSNPEAFRGSLHGQGHEIRNLYIARPSEHDVGLFGFVGLEGAIQDVGLVGFAVSGSSRVAGLAGWSFGTIVDSHAVGTVTGDLAGGLVGYLHGTVINSYYDYDNVLINGHSMITIGALASEDFGQWLMDDKTLDVSARLSQEDGYYLIGSASDFRQLLAFGQDDALRFRLTQDLDLSSDPGFFVPYLAAEFDGDGHKIANLSLDFESNRAGAVGLFGFLAREGHVSRLGVESVTINCEAVYIGGLVGCNWWGSVSDSYSTGIVTGGGIAGGLVGCDWGAVSNSHSKCDVTGSVAGGLVGWNAAGSICDSHAGGSVTGNLVGGLAGVNKGTISSSHATGMVSGDDVLGGLVGSSSAGDDSIPPGVVTDSFWDIQSSGQGSSAGGTGKTTAEMKRIATFLGAGWDIVAVALGERNTAYVWNIVDGQTYPFLSWQPVS